jgi:hypothetical protein
MKRLFWFGLGIYAGVQLNRRGKQEWQAVKSDPLREVDRVIRFATPLVRSAIRTVRPSNGV